MSEILFHSAAAASRPAALRIWIFPIFALVAPCRPGASTASVLTTLRTRDTRGPIPGRSRVLPALTLALLSAGTLLACSARSGQPGPPNVVLVTIDTLRADHLGCYGYPRPTSPRIDAYARGATLYRNAVSTAPWTVPSHASLFTGRYPFEHGAHTFRVERPVSNNVNPLAPEHVTLAEVLKAAGYTTAAFVANNVFLKKTYQLDQGFDTWEVHRVRAPEVNRRVFAWLDGKPDRPFFLFVNYMDLHRPYNTTPRPGSGLPEPVQDGRLIDTLKERIMGSEDPVPEDLVRTVIDQYDTALANADEAVGALVDRLAAMGLADETLVVVTSDHGEAFGEHRLVEHSKDLYQPEVAIPLVIRAPGQTAGERVDTLVSLVDVPRMILAHLPAEIARKAQAQFPYAPGEHPVIAEVYYGRLQDLFGVPWAKRLDRVRSALFAPPWKLIRTVDGPAELYEMTADPAELTDLAGRDAERARDLTKRLEAFMDPRRRFTPRNDERELTEEEMKELKSLGYL